MKTKKKIHSETAPFHAFMSLFESMGPFHSDPCVDRAYRALRLLGLDREQTIKFLQKNLLVCKKEGHPEHRLFPTS